MKPAALPVRMLNVMCSVLLGLIGISAGSLLLGVRLNVMPSFPLGLYRITAAKDTLRHGDLVLFHTESSRRFMAARHGWVAGWWPIMKPIAALPGDEVCHKMAGILVQRTANHDVLHIMGPWSCPKPSPMMVRVQRFPRRWRTLPAHSCGHSILDTWAGSPRLTFVVSRNRCGHGEVYGLS